MSKTDRISIYGLSLHELREWCKDRGHKDYRAPQVWRWLYVHAVKSWDDMNNIPLKLRDAMAETFLLRSAECVKTLGEVGTTQKLLIRLQDEEAIETVVIPARGRLTVCLSSQVGCKFKCAFCASGQGGFHRDLGAGEMIEQILVAAEMVGKSPTHVVFMGIGEPLDNYDAVLKAARIINDGEGLRIGARRITISTCGIIPGMKRLADENLQVELSVSLHAAKGELRTRLMPVNQQYPVAQLIDACGVYTRKTGRIITFEYSMIDGENDSRQRAKELVDLLRPLSCRVNLIQLSTVSEYSGRTSRPEVCKMFMDVLKKAGINTTLRRSQGGAFEAACGQLRANRA